MYHYIKRRMLQLFKWDALSQRFWGSCHIGSSSVQMPGFVLIMNLTQAKRKAAKDLPLRITTWPVISTVYPELCLD